MKATTEAQVRGLSDLVAQKNRHIHDLHIAVLAAEKQAEEAEREKESYRIEADCAMRDYDALELTTNIALEEAERENERLRGALEEAEHPFDASEFKVVQQENERLREILQRIRAAISFAEPETSQAREALHESNLLLADALQEAERYREALVYIRDRIRTSFITRKVNAALHPDDHNQEETT